MNHLKIPFFSILQHPKCSDTFFQFALNEHSEETYSFVKDAEQYRRLSTGKYTASQLQIYKVKHKLITHKSSSSTREVSNNNLYDDSSAPNERNIDINQMVKPTINLAVFCLTMLL